MDKVERLLIIFIKGKELGGDSISEGIIYEKALEISHDFRKKIPGMSTKDESAFTFKASRGWFERFKHRSDIHNVNRHREAANSNKEVAEKYVVEFSENVKAESFLPKQVFFYNDETGLFSKKISSKTYNIQEEKTLLRHKSMKDRLTPLQCVNASGDCKFKQMTFRLIREERMFRVP